MVALNNDTKPVEVRISGHSLPNDALGLCPAPRHEADMVILVIPPRTGCIF